MSGDRWGCVGAVGDRYRLLAACNVSSLTNYCDRLGSLVGVNDADADSA